MTPRFMVVCLGGLAGAGALVCCDLDDGAEASEVQTDGEAIESVAGEAEPTEAELAPVHWRSYSPSQ